MYQTFDGAMDEAGDTQPDSQMFKQYTSGIYDDHSISVPNLDAAGDMSGDPPTDDIDMIGSSQSQASKTITSPTVIQDDMDIQIGDDVPITSPLKFETPAVAGWKRNNQGEILSSAMKTDTTPGTVLSASAFFGFGNGVNGNSMSLTQAFNATQARTSPIVEAPTEDSVFQRPSPNFTNGGQRKSSPPAGLSSPIKEAARTYPAAGNSMLRSSSEPRADYETLKQSQERRKRDLQHEDTSTSLITQDSWDEPTAAQQRLIRRKAKEKLDQEAARVLAGVSAPTPSVRRSKKRGLVSVDRKKLSPIKDRARASALFDGPNDSDDQGDSPDELSQQMDVDPQDDEESPDELSQDVPVRARASRSVRPAKEAVAKQLVQVPNTSSIPRPHTLSGQPVRSASQPDTPSSQLQREIRFHAPGSQLLHKSLAKLKSSKESEVIMDSQPEEGVETPRPPKALRFPSSPSSNQYSINQTVMHSQTGHTSPVVSSSIPPMPPKSSSQEQTNVLTEDPRPGRTEEGVPSSPPVVSQDEITYDEHAYEEHSEDNRQSQDGHLTEDEEMNDDEDLPVAQDGLEKPENVESDAHARTVDKAPEAEEPGSDNVKMHSDDEIPETMEQHLPELHNEDEELIRSSHPEDDVERDTNTHVVSSRKTRQSTVPETDTLDETQPSHFPEVDNGLDDENGEEDNSAAVEDHEQTDTTSTGAFHTGKEQQIASQSATAPSGSAKEGASSRPSSGPNVRPLLDIANQPSTQRSTDLDAFEMPNLSFADEAQDTLAGASSGSAPARPHKKRKVTYTAKKAFRSPIKETDPLSDEAPLSPTSHGKQQQTSAPPLQSTPDNEARGATAAARARDAALAQPAVLKSKLKQKPKSDQPRTRRNGALKAVKKELLTRSPRGTKTSRRDSTAEVEPVSSVKAADVDVEMADADEGDTEPDELAGPSPQKPKTKVIMKSTSDEGEAPAGGFLTPNRVFAAWPQGHFWPATCLRRYDANRYQVRYDFDGTIHEVATTSVRALDLRPGDQVKLEIKGMKKQTYVVVGFKNRIVVDDISEEYPSTDQRGYTTLVVEEKERDSLPAIKKGQISTPTRLDVQISTIYLTNTIWRKFLDRSFTYTMPATPTASASHDNTPGAQDKMVTPAHFKRSTAGPSLLRDSTARAGSIASSVRSSGTAFDNMVFAVSITDKSLSKDAHKKFTDDVTRLITSNGGRIMEGGFHDMFDAESNDGPKSEATVHIGLDGLVLKRKYENVTFAALISDSFSRRAKHCQALALNIPVLHLRWLHDSIAAMRALPFAKYLLPAGVSTFLDPEGIIRSRTMHAYDPADESISFVDTVRGRDPLLHNQNVLLMTGASKKEFVKKQPYMFLLHALGPSKFARCRDLLTAKDLVTNDDWDWVCVDGGAEGVANAASVLFGKKNTSTAASKKKAGGRKRKAQDAAEAEMLITSGIVGGKKVQIACDEFVIQSLILGALIEEE